METLNKYHTIKLPLYNQSNTLNKFEIKGNKFIATQQTNGLYKVSDGLFSSDGVNTSKQITFDLPENHKQKLDFESDLTISYKIINGEFHLIKIDALYSEDYIEMIESNSNVFPVFKNGFISFSSENNTANFHAAS